MHSLIHFKSCIRLSTRFSSPHGFFSSNPKKPSDSPDDLKNPQAFSIKKDKEEFDAEAFEEELKKIRNPDNYDDYSTVVTETKEQMLSSRLFGVTSPDEVLAVYLELLKERQENPQTSSAEAMDPAKNPFNYHELCLFFYFLNMYDGPVSDRRLLESLVASLFLHLRPVILEFCDSFIFAIGNSIRRELVSLDRGTKAKIAQGVAEVLDQEPCPVRSITALLHSIQVIYNEPLDRDLLDTLSKKICQKAMENAKEEKMDFEIMDAVNILMCLLTTPGERGKDPEFLRIMAEMVEKNLEQVNQENIGKIIHAFVESGYQKQEFLQTLHDILESFCDEMNPSDLCSVFLCYSRLYKGDSAKVSSLLRAIYKEIPNLGISDYMNLWLGLAGFSPRSLEEVSPVIEELKKRLASPSEWTAKDLEPFELVNIVVSMASLKVNDQEFLQVVISELRIHMRILDEFELYPLTCSFVVYSNQFPDFFVKLHSLCCENFEKFDQEEKKGLEAVFSKRKDLISNSPFLIHSG